LKKKGGGTGGKRYPKTLSKLEKICDWGGPCRPAKRNQKGKKGKGYLTKHRNRWKRGGKGQSPSGWLIGNYQLGVGLSKKMARLPRGSRGPFKNRQNQNPLRGVQRGGPGRRIRGNMVDRENGVKINMLGKLAMKVKMRQEVYYHGMG